MLTCAITMNHTNEGRWNMTGYVVSDCGAVHNATASIEAGCDLECPFGAQENAQFNKLGNLSRVSTCIFYKYCDKQIFFCSFSSFHFIYIYISTVYVCNPAAKSGMQWRVRWCMLLIDGQADVLVVEGAVLTVLTGINFWHLYWQRRHVTVL